MSIYPEEKDALWSSIIMHISGATATSIGVSAKEEHGTVQPDTDVVLKMIDYCFWSGAKQRLYVLDRNNHLNQYTQTQALAMLKNQYEPLLNHESIRCLIRTTASNTTDKDIAQIAKNVVNDAYKIALDHIVQNQQRDRIDWRVDMFAHKNRIEYTHNKARLFLTHEPYHCADPEYDDETIADFREHFSRFEEWIDFTVYSRFASDRKKSYLWIWADSDWGKGLLMSVLTDIGAAIQTDKDEIKAIMSGKAVGKEATDFVRAIALVVNEFSAVNAGFKKLESEIEISAKYQLSSTVEIFSKQFFSAENVPSLVGDSGVEDQFANRMNLFQESGSIDKRSTFKRAGQHAYFSSLKAYVVERINERISRLQRTGRDDATREADDWLQGFMMRNGISNYYERFSASIPSLAMDIIEALENGNFAARHQDKIIKDGKYSYLKSPSLVIGEFINEHYDESQRQAVRKKMTDIQKAMCADGIGNKSHRINGRNATCIKLTKTQVQRLLDDTYRSAYERLSKNTLPID